MTGDEELQGGVRWESGGSQALDALERELRALAARVDPPPAELFTAAKVAFGLRAIEAELAVLLLDSWDPTSSRALASVRSGQEPRLLSFDLGDTTVDLEVTAVPGGCEVVGGVSPGRPDALEVESPGGRRPTRLDDLGRFVERVGTGPLRFRARFSERLVVTPWVTL